MLGHTKAIRIAATAALALGAVLGIAAPALAVAAPPCPSGHVCIWQNALYSGTRGTYAGSNTNWGTDFSPAGFWNDSVSSAYNNLSAAHQTALFWNADGFYGQSAIENPSFCMNFHANTADTQNFVNINFPHGTFNDNASSDIVYTGSSAWCGVLN
jgi:hypothetical protein